VSTGPTAPRTSTSSTPPAGDVPAGLLGKDLEVMPTSRKEIALTFDGGGDDRAVAPILATLRRTATPGTFFLTGDFVQEFPASARAIAAAHRIGNHTQSHPFLTTLGDARVRAEITSAQAAIRTATGKDPRPWFRFPAGDRDARVIADANVLGYACIRWTVDSLGWKGTTGQQSVATVTERVLAAARPGAIVLMHVGAHPKDGTILDANALDAVIAGLRAKGYTLVSLDVMLS
jgi:peptidoglycan/xylan/chitin deacetylase (PgdA/CDA1 family)